MGKDTLPLSPLDVRKMNLATGQDCPAQVGLRSHCNFWPGELSFEGMRGQLCPAKVRVPPTPWEWGVWGTGEDRSGMATWGSWWHLGWAIWGNRKQGEVAGAS